MAANIEENMGRSLRDVGIARGSALMESLVMNYIERCQDRKADTEKMSPPTNLDWRVGKMEIMSPTPHEDETFPGGAFL